MAGVLPTTLSIIATALQDLGVMGIGDSTPHAEDLEFALKKYNPLLGQFNTRRRKAYFERFQSFTFTAAQTSYTIGTSANSADFVVTSGDRPVKIDRAQVVLTDTSPDTFINIPVWNWPEYTLLALPGLTGEWPVGIYYAPETPNGIIYPYYASPSQTAYQLRLWWWNQFETVALADISTALNLPPGMERSLTLKLSEALSLAFPVRTNLDELRRQSRIAWADYESLNVPPPEISSTDGIQSGYGTFNYLSRTWGP